MNPRLTIFAVIVFSIGTIYSPAGNFRVRNSIELRSSLPKLKPGDVLELEPGTYQGGILVSNLHGASGKMITIQGSDPDNRPLITGGKSGIQFSDCSYLWIRNLVLRNFPSNGINIDDGGSLDSPAHHIVVDNVEITDIGPTVNVDPLKMSGVDHFKVRNCRFVGWGGQAIDMVGCHEGVVEGCHFEGKDGFSQTVAVQCKGGSRKVLIHKCYFLNVGQRGINLGGNTGLPYFRPQGVDYEAKDIEVAGNIFIGGLAPVAFATSVGGSVHHNTIIQPDKWVVRILQEQRGPGFKPCREGIFLKNLIVFDRKVQVFVNVGGGTDPESFSFEGNCWYGTGGIRKPRLPVMEKDGLYDIDPGLKISGLEVSVGNAKLRKVGAHSYDE